MNGNESCNRCESVESTEPLKGKDDSYVCNLCKSCTKEVKEYLELPTDEYQYNMIIHKNLINTLEALKHGKGRGFCSLCEDAWADRFWTGKNGSVVVTVCLDCEESIQEFMDVPEDEIPKYKKKMTKWMGSYIDKLEDLRKNS